MVKKRIGWLRGRPIIQDIGVQNNVLEEVVQNSKENFSFGKYTGTTKGLTWTIKTSYYVPCMASDIQNIINNSINGIAYFSSYKGTFDFDTLVVDTTIDTARDNAAQFLSKLSKLEELSIIGPVYSSAWYYSDKPFTTTLKRININTSDNINGFGYFNEEQNPVLEKVNIILSKSTVLAGNLCHTHNLKELNINAPLLITMSGCFNNIGFNNRIKLNINNGNLNKVTDIADCFNNLYTISKLNFKTASCNVLAYSMQGLYSCRELTIDLTNYNDICSFRIQTCTEGLSTTFIEGFNEVKNHSPFMYKTQEDYKNDLYMRVLDIGNFGKNNGVLNLFLQMCVHRTLMLDVFNKLFDRRSAGYTVLAQISLPSITFNELTDSDIAVATNKGFTVVSV